MKYIKNDCNDPYYNLALEEYILKNLDPSSEYVILWQNKPSIIIGKHQNTVEEINSEFVKENDICVVRRMTGGGAVYHDLGNLNFTFIDHYDKGNLLNFEKYTLPIIYALKEIGIEANLSGRNDLTIDGKKFSGNCQHIYKNRLLHHGTLLFNSKLDTVQKALNVSMDKIVSKGIKSVRSRVTNISDYLSKDLTLKEFENLVLTNLFKVNNYPLEEYLLSEEELLNINKLMNEKYVKWEWNYGESPKFNLKNSRRFSGGKIEVLMDVNKGIINRAKIYGDFLGVLDIVDIEKLLQGKKYEEKEIEYILDSINIKEYFGNISKQELLSFIF